jgi:hypothetical protein
VEWVKNVGWPASCVSSAFGMRDVLRMCCCLRSSWACEREGLETILVVKMHAFGRTEWREFVIWRNPVQAFEGRTTDLEATFPLSESDRGGNGVAFVVYSVLVLPLTVGRPLRVLFASFRVAQWLPAISGDPNAGGHGKRSGIYA